MNRGQSSVTTQARAVGRGAASLTLLVGALAAPLLACGTTTLGMAQDSGTPVLDGGSAPQDGGTLPVDAGAPQDGGLVLGDGGTASDGGSLPEDGGEKLDGGSGEDGGAPQVDGGAPLEDGGVGDGGGWGEQDGGAVAEDGGPAPEDGGTPDAGAADAGINPYDPANDTRDSDCDGLTDAEELSTVYANGLKTDPLNPDTDGDGVPDGVEVGRTSSPDPRCVGFVGDLDPSTRTDPTNPDSDGDGLEDGAEDANHNGRVDPGETDPRNPDSDADGLTDGEEVTVFGTSPLLRDTDGDGIPDWVEIHVTHTNPLNPDSDGDGLTDGQEDRNWNGRVDPGETNPLVSDNPFVDSDGDGLTDFDEIHVYHTDPQNPDTDGDGLSDGEEVVTYHTNPLRQDSDCDGLTDGQEVLIWHTNPLLADTDGDGLPDGLEVGVTVNPDPAHCPNVKLDLCPSSTTDPRNPDSDGDGLADGVEDANQNGCVDPPGDGGVGETDPLNPNDNQGAAEIACSVSQLRPLIFQVVPGQNVQTARAAEFSEVSELTVGGQKVGAMYYDGTNDLLAFVLSKTPAGANLAAEEAAGRAVFEAVATISVPTTQSFQTWDGLAALLAQYDWGAAASGAPDLRSKVGRAVAGLLGNPSTLDGLLSPGGPSGAHKLRVEYVWRSAQQVLVLGVAAASPAAEAQEIRMLDLVNGSALGDAFDTASVQCDRFRSGPAPKVDFLWVIDNSGSMNDNQGALAAAADAMIAQITSAGLDWRMAVTYTDLHVAPSSSPAADVCGPPQIAGCDGGTRGPGRRRICPFLDADAGTQVLKCGTPECAYFNAGTCGNGSERGFNSARRAIDRLLSPDGGCEPVPGTSCQLRPGAQLVVIFFTDTGEQTTASDSPPGADGGNTTADWIRYFQSAYRPDAGPALVHGLLCPLRPDGGSTGPCSDNLLNSAQYDRYSDLVRALGGVEGSSRDGIDAQRLPDTIRRILNAVFGSVSPYRLSRPPISTSLKMAVERPAVDGGFVVVPRSSTDGFDYNGATNTVALYGTFFPDAPDREIAVSYRYWVNGEAPPPQPQCPTCAPPLLCDPATLTCICPPDCGASRPSPRHRCDPISCTWVCAPDCGGECTGYRLCHPDTCSCACRDQVTCAPGYTFDGNACDCVCNTSALGCDPVRYDADPLSCACVCKPDCGCADPATCIQSLCQCDEG
jgi:hypothetical protein